MDAHGDEKMPVAVTAATLVVNAPAPDADAHCVWSAPLTPLAKLKANSTNRRLVNPTEAPPREVARIWEMGRRA